MLRVQTSQNSLIEFGTDASVKILSSGTGTNVVSITGNASVNTIQTLLKQKGDSILASRGYHCYVRVLRRTPLELTVWKGPLKEEPGVDW